MTFRKAVVATQGLKAAFQPGLQALPNSDRQRITCRNGRKLAGSANLDQALRQSHANSPRWDYAIGLKQTSADKVFWVEVHPATAGEVKVVLAKLAWLRNWLVQVNSPLNQLEREHIWIASGKTTFTAQSPQAKTMAVQGLRCVGGHYQIC